MKSLIGGVAVALLVAGPVVASDFEKQIETRQAHMSLIGYNVGVLGAMAKGKMDYDSVLASDVATNIFLAASMKNSTLWPAGSDMDSVEGTKAKAAIWSNGADVAEKFGAFRAAAKTLSEQAGVDLASLRSAMGPVGKSCKSCHSDYKAK